MDAVRERTDSEKQAFLEGFKTCLSTVKSDLSKGEAFQSAVAHAEAIAKLIGPLPVEHATYIRRDNNVTRPSFHPV